VNGIDAMKDTPTENRIISIRTSRLEKFAELSVSDGGSGIPEDKLKEVFEPFFTSKAEGMGMGLSIARTIIEAHNGQISAKNRDHGGRVLPDQASSVQGRCWIDIARTSCSCYRRAVLLVGPAHDDPERVIRQWPLQRLGLIPRCAHSNIALLIGRQDH
jgi:hypothetical protein